MGTLVHDVVGGLSLASGNLRLIETWVQDDFEANKDKILVAVSRGLEGCKNGNDAIDYGYRKIKELENLEDEAPATNTGTVTAQVVIISNEGVLGVSRKTDHADFGLPGGKMEPGDMGDPKATAIREVKEETGLDIHNLRLILAMHSEGSMSYTYLADHSGEISHEEPHVVTWTTFDRLSNGSFGKYNSVVSESLRSYFLAVGRDF